MTVQEFLAILLDLASIKLQNMQKEVTDLSQYNALVSHLNRRQSLFDVAWYGSVAQLTVVWPAVISTMCTANTGVSAASGSWSSRLHCLGSLLLLSGFARSVTPVV